MLASFIRPLESFRTHFNVHWLMSHIQRSLFIVSASRI